MFFVMICFSAPVQAQYLGEVLTVAAISSELNPAIRLPSGSYRVVGDVPAGLVARVPNAAGISSWEAYTATGVAMNLQAGFVQQVMSSFAVSGYFLEGQTETQVGDETSTNYVFVGDDGGRVVLHVFRSPRELVWLIGK